mmetsp:Transcript_32733/g.71861  ORF Transcript_32733/g.71861 Transcript_32733/m.71861 type:complete len:1394 (+) Transcript_32733:168-4349(+)
MNKKAVRIAPAVERNPLAINEHGGSIRLSDTSCSNTRSVSGRYAPEDQNRMRRKSSATILSVDGGSITDRTLSRRPNLHRSWRRLCSKPAFATIFPISVEMLCTTIIAAVIPYNMAFSKADTFPAYIFQYVIDVVASLCVVARIRRARKAAHRRPDLNSRFEVLAHSLSHAPFWLRLCLTLPFDIFLWIDPRTRSAVKYVRWVHLLPTPSIMGRFFTTLDATPQINFTLIRCLRSLVSLGMVTHWLGCMLFFFSERSYADTYRTGKWRVDNDNEGSVDYVRMLYFSLLAQSSTATEFVAVDRDGGGKTWEYALGIVIIVVTNMTFLYISSTLTSMIIRTFQRLDDFRTKLGLVNSYLRRHRISKQLRRLATEHFQHGLETQHVDDSYVLQFLPQYLSREVLREKNMRVLRRTPVLLSCDKSVLLLLATLVRQCTFLKGETLCTQGDVVLELLVLESGELVECKASDEEEGASEEEEEDVSSFDEASEVLVPVAGADTRESESTMLVETAEDTWDENSSPVEPRAVPTDKPAAALLGQPNGAAKANRTRSSMGTSDTASNPTNEPSKLAKGESDVLNLMNVDKRQQLAKTGAQGEVKRVINTPGAVICELAFFYAVRGPSTIVAVSRTSCLSLDRDAYKQLARDHPAEASRMKKQALELGKVVHPDVVATIVASTGPSSDYERSKVDSLFHMVANGDETGVREHLSVDGKATDPASKDYAGQTPLHVAALRGLPRMVSLLLEGSAPPTALDPAGRTPLDCAIIAKSHESVRLLAAARHGDGGDGGGSLLGASEVALASLLCEAAQESDVDMLDMLMSAGIPINSSDWDNRTCLHVAAGTGHKSFIKLLLAKGANINAMDRWGSTPMRDAIDNHHYDAARLLASKGGRLTHSSAAAAANELASSVASGSLDHTTLLVDCGCDVNAADCDKLTSLHRAAGLGNLAITKMLIDKKADVDCADRWGNKPILLAVRASALETAHELLRHGASLSMAPAHAARELAPLVRDGHFEHVRVLVDAGLELNAADADGRSCVHLAASAGNLVAIKALAELRCELSAQDSAGATPLSESVARGHLGVARLLVESRAQLNAERAPTQLLAHARGGEAEAVALLLAGGADADATDDEGRTCLHIAAAAGNTQLVRAVLECGQPCVEAHGSCVNKRDGSGATALGLAVRYGHGASSKLLWQRGAKLLLDDGETHAQLASLARSGDVASLRLMVSMGADADAADAEGRTCLMTASATGDANAVRALLDANADANAVDQRGVSALEEAVRADHAHVVKLLRAAGAEIQMDALALANVLCDCARRGFLQRSALLLSCGADVNAADYDRRTALHVAAAEGNAQMVSLLLSHGADCSLKDAVGGTALDSAARGGFHDVCKLFSQPASTAGQTL